MRYGLKLVIVGAVSVAAALLTILFGVFDRYGKRVYTIGQLWSRVILAIAGVRLKVRGLHQLDAAQQYVFIVNHQSNLDIPVLVRTLKPFQLRWLAKKELLWVPFFGWAIVAGKHIIVDRTDRSAALDSFARAKQLISGGISPVIFPEGTRSGTGRLLPFKRGGFLLAAMTGTPIVPITINGSGAVLPPGAWRLRSGAVEVVVHAPISSENHRPGTLRVLSDHVREIIAGELRKAGAAEQGPARAGAVHSSIRAMTIDTES